jgi:HEAT repeat protein
MRDEIKVAVLLGRLIDLLTQAPEISDDHRTALHALADLLARRSASVVLEKGQLTVEGEAVPEVTPFTAPLRDRLTAHEVARLHLAFGTSAVDVVELVRGLIAQPARDAPARALSERLIGAGLVGVFVVSREQEAAAVTRRAVRVTEALKAVEAPPAPQAPAAPARPTLAGPDVTRRQRPVAGTIAGAVERLQDETDLQPLLARLDAVQVAIVRAIGANELTQALEGLLRLIRQESETTHPDTQRQYGIALRRLLTAEHLKKFAPMAFDEMYHEDIALMMRRAGKQGTKILLDLLIEAPSQAERLAYLRALRQMEEGADVIASLLTHHEWFVVRNAADLVGEMKIVEAVPALTRAAQHSEARVRRAVGLALARIATAETALPLRKLVTDSDPQVRLAVVKEVGGRALSGLAMPLVSAASTEEDPDIRSEYYRALGRIGTPDAVAALGKAAQEGGGLLSRKPAGPRLAAIAALGVAGGPNAVALLKELAQSRTPDVRAAAAAALQQVSPSGE